MIYRFTFISDEVDDFRREIQIDPDDTFLSLHQAICEACGYDNKQLSSFFICSDEWEKHEEITLEEMDSNSEFDTWVMKDTRISELVEEEKQKLIYVFDYMTDRCMFVKLSEIITGKNLKEPLCTKSRGDAPAQSIDFDEFEKKAGSTELGEEFYGDQDYNIDEIDREGFEGLDDLPSDAFDSTDIY
mgnify:CR=1 FL=1